MYHSLIPLEFYNEPVERLNVVLQVFFVQEATMKYCELENAIMMNMVKDSSVLSKEEELELIRKYQAGNQKALEKLISANIKFAIKEAGKYEGRGMDKADLISEACLGMIVAAGKFDISKNLRFVTYAVWWIRDAIQHALFDGGQLIHLPRAKRNDPELNAKFANVASLDKLIGDEEDGLSLSDLVRSEEICDTENDAVWNVCAEEVMDSMQSLTETERMILEMHYGINSEYRTYNLREISEVTGYTKEGVRQIIERATNRLRRETQFYAA